MQRNRKLLIIIIVVFVCLDSTTFLVWMDYQKNKPVMEVISKITSHDFDNMTKGMAAGAGTGSTITNNQK